MFKIPDLTPAQSADLDKAVDGLISVITEHLRAGIAAALNSTEDPVSGKPVDQMLHVLTRAIDQVEALWDRVSVDEETDRQVLNLCRTVWTGLWDIKRQLLAQRDGADAATAEHAAAPTPRVQQPRMRLVRPSA